MSENQLLIQTGNSSQKPWVDMSANSIQLNQFQLVTNPVNGYVLKCNAIGDGFWEPDSGATGPTGPAGPTGATGATGASGSVQYTITTHVVAGDNIDPSEEYIIQPTGTSAVTNLVLPLTTVVHAGKVFNFIVNYAPFTLSATGPDTIVNVNGGSGASLVLASPHGWLVISDGISKWYVQSQSTLA